MESLTAGWPTTAQQGDFTWSIDHCHRTGSVRGLLCASCNSALGMVKDDPTILAALIEYLKRS
jgi:Recombination endonuclease VII